MICVVQRIMEYPGGTGRSYTLNCAVSNAPDLIGVNCKNPIPDNTRTELETAGDGAKKFVEAIRNIPNAGDLLLLRKDGFTISLRDLGQGKRPWETIQPLIFSALRDAYGFEEVMVAQ